MDGTQAGSEKAIRGLVNAAISRCPKKREQIAAELAEHLQQHITLHMLNTFTSEAKKTARFPAAFVAAFCEVTGDDQLQRFIMGHRLSDLLNLGEVVEAVLGRNGLLRLSERGRSRKKRNSCRK